jgi:hypothetical protein
MDEKLRTVLGLLNFMKHHVINSLSKENIWGIWGWFNSNLQNLQIMYEATCIAAHPKLRVFHEYIVTVAKTVDPEIDIQIDSDMHRLMDTIAEIVCQETEQLTSNFITKMLINDPDLEFYERITQLLKQSHK